MRIHIDFETYSTADIKKTGAWTYSKHPSTEVLCMAYAVEDNKPELWLPGDPVPEFLFDEDSHIYGWNVFFEYCIWTHVLKWPKLNNSQWFDSMAKACAFAMPRSLGQCALALGFDEDNQKDKRGKYLIQRLCKPLRNKRCDDPFLMDELYKYCLQDVVVEREVHNKLPSISKEERDVWIIDFNMNQKGVPIDVETLKNALDIIEKNKKYQNKNVDLITNGELKNVSQVAKVKEYFEKKGFILDNFQKNYLEEVIKDENLHESLKKLIKIRQDTGSTSLAKYNSLEALIGEDDSAHGLLLYHGAATGRWSGKHFQPQNLPRPTIKNVDECIEDMKERDHIKIIDKYGSVSDALSSCIRGVIKARSGNRFLIADYSAIEARVLPWLAGQEDILEVFKTHGKIYEYTASQIYGVSPDSIGKDSEERFIGKVATLALGYQGGVNAFVKMAENYGVSIEEAKAKDIVDNWREANSKIRDFWYEIEKAASLAVHNMGNKGYSISVRDITFKVEGDFLYCVLPSGRKLSYYDPSIEKNNFGKKCVSFMRVNSVTRKWERQTSYGGKFVENITQAVARDVMVNAIKLLNEKGYNIILTVHDEIIAENDEDFGGLDDFIQTMCTLPEWAEGLPLAAAGEECYRYQK